MYVLVQHTISDPATFWNAADPSTLSPDVKLHHTFPTPDGTRAACIWEAQSVDAVRNLLEPLVGRISRNEYFPVENREGFARPSGVPQTAAAGTR
ncbi:MAG TPA: hypothetical protein VHG35_08995 [Gemmatimonadales bacterium]|nr:hypothetical protein [Gemmatimonadales bacterium]